MAQCGAAGRVPQLCPGVQGAQEQEARVSLQEFYLEGIRIDPRAGKKMHKLRPERQIWREGDVRKRLHFTPSYKVKITNRAARLLQGGLTNPGAWIRD